MNDVYSIFPVKIKRGDNFKYQKHIALLSKHPRFKALIKFLGPLKYAIPIWNSIDDTVLYAVIGHNNYTRIKKYIAGNETTAVLYLWELLNRNLLENFKKARNG